MALAAALMVTAGLAQNESAAKEALARCLDDGRAAERFAKMVSALGGPIDLLENADKYLRAAPVVKPIVATRAGVVAAYDTRAVGMAVVSLGGGRMRAADAIDAYVGFTDFVSIGAQVNAGEPIAVVHARTDVAALAAMQAFQQAITISDAPLARSPLIQTLP